MSKKKKNTRNTITIEPERDNECCAESDRHSLRQLQTISTGNHYCDAAWNSSKAQGPGMRKGVRKKGCFGGWREWETPLKEAQVEEEKKSRKKWDGEIDRWNNLYTRSNNFRKRWIMHPNGCARALTPRTTHLHFDIVVDDAFFFFFWILFYLFSFFFLPSHQ
jgi:hypothetical protein